MAHSDQLPDAVLDHLESQLNVKSSPFPALSGPPNRIAETFSVWSVGRDSLLSSPDTTLDQLAVRTSRWHHQVLSGEQVRAFARSTPLGAGEEDWRITEMAASEIANKLDQTISWIDEYVPGDPLARLLVVPAYHLHAFWLSGEGRNQVVVADLPPGIADLQENRLYDESEFLQALRQGQTIVGIDY